MDDTGIGYPKVEISGHNSDQKQNFNVILVPESVLVALSKSATPNENGKSVIATNTDDSLLKSSELVPSASTIVQSSLKSVPECHQDKNLTESPGVVLLDDGEEWFVNIDFEKSLKETSQILHDGNNSTMEPETALIQNLGEIYDSQNEESSHQDKSNKRETEKAFKCTVFNCHRKFETELQLKIHVENHDKQKIHQCSFPGCPWSFSTPYKLRRHALSHKQTKPFKCNHPGCGVSCSTKYNLKAHQQVHKAEDKSFCALCNISFTSKLQMLKHQRLKHEKEAVLTCCHENCDKKFHTSAARAAHLKTHQRTKFACWAEDCKKEFHKLAALKEHVLSKHTKIRPFKCKYPDCTWEFTTNSKLKRHMMIHTGVKSWACPFEKCSSKFYRKEHLKSHLRTHTTSNKDQVKGLNDPDAPVELSLEDILYYFCPYEDCGSLFASQMGAKQHIQKMHRCSHKSETKNVSSDSTTEGEIPSTSQANMNAISKAIVCDEEITNDSCGDTVTTSISILDALMDATISPTDDTSSSVANIISTQANMPLRQFITTSSNTEFSHDISSQPASSSNETPHFLVLNSNDMDFHMNSASVLQNTMGYGNVSNSEFPAQATTSSADQYFAFPDCVQTVDPNIVMAVKSPLQKSKLVENKQQTVDVSSEDENGDARDENISGCARTDCEAYYKLKIRKEWNSKEVVENISPEKSQLHYDESIQDFILHEAEILQSDQLNEKMASCVDRHFESSTINLGDLA